MAAGDRLLGPAGDVALDAAGNVMLSNGAGDTCCCQKPCQCTCTDKSTNALKCSHCTCDGSGVDCTPRRVLLTISGVTTVCHVIRTNTYHDANGAVVSGSQILTHDGGCEWFFDEDPGTTYNDRVFSGDLAADQDSPTCSGTPDLQNLSISWSVLIENVSGTKYVRVWVGADNDVFCGRTPFIDCNRSYTIDNGTASCPTFTPGGIRGTATVVFCY